MNEVITIPKIEIPVILIIKEVDKIDNKDLICAISKYLSELNLNPVLISLNDNSKQNIQESNFIRIPDFITSHTISIYEKIKELRNIIIEKINSHNYNIAIVDIPCGILQYDEEEKLEFLPIEIIEATKPDYTIAHILAEDYTEPNHLINQLELKTRVRINSIEISNTFFDIVKYRENGTRRFLSFSDNTIRRLADRLSPRVNIPVFSRIQIEQLCGHIINNMCYDIGDCRKVGE